MADPETRPGRVRRFNRWLDRRILSDLPEASLFPSEEARRAAVRELDTDLERSDRFWIAIVATVAAVMAIAWATMELVGGLVAIGRVWLIALANAVFFPVGYLAVVWVWRRAVARRLRDKLIDLGVAVCRRCGYPLRGLTEHRCPECGWPADEQVREILRG